MSGTTDSWAWAGHSREGMLFAQALQNLNIEQARHFMANLDPPQIQLGLKIFRQDAFLNHRLLDYTAIARFLLVNNLVQSMHLWLLHFCVSGQAGAVSYLLSQGADANAYDTVPENHSTLQTPLFLGARSGNVEVARVLIANGAAVDRFNHEKRTALFNAAIYGRSEMARYLLSQGANPNHADVYGYTCLHAIAVHDTEATVEDRVRTAQEIVAMGADLSKQDNKQNTARYFWETNFTLTGQVETLDALTARRQLETATPDAQAEQDARRL